MSRRWPEERDQKLDPISRAWSIGHMEKIAVNKLTRPGREGEGGS